MAEVKRQMDRLNQYKREKQVERWTQGDVHGIVLWAIDKGFDASLRRLVAALSEELVRQGVQDWTKDPDMKRAVKGVEKRRIEAAPEREGRQPLPFSAVRKYFVLPPPGTRREVWARNRVLLLLAWATMRRPGEWKQVVRRNVWFDERGWLHIKLARTKTMPKGRTIVVETTGGPFCPVRAVQDYLRNWPKDPEDAFFPDMGQRGVHRDRGMSGSAVSQVVKKAADFAGLKGQFSGHSLRIGGATAALAGGATLEQIRAVGDWTSDAVWLYLRAIGAAQAGVQKMMGL